MAMDSPKRRLAAIAAYARGKAPYVGVVVEQDGVRRTLVFRRQHLAAAAACPGILTVKYDADANMLILNGGRNRYALRGLKDGDKYWQRCGTGMSHRTVDIRGELTRWAGKRRGHSAKPKATLEQFETADATLNAEA